MKSPLEFSQPHSPVLGSWMQPVPKPSSLPLSLQKKKKRSVTRNPTLMICIRGGEDTHFQKKVQPPLLELSSDSVGASQVYASHVP